MNLSSVGYGISISESISLVVLDMGYRYRNRFRYDSDKQTTVFGTISIGDTYIWISDIDIGIDSGTIPINKRP